MPTVNFTMGGQQYSIEAGPNFMALSSEDKKKNRLSLGPDLRIVSVGSATRHDERSVRVPLVLGDADGATASIALTISLDGIVEEGDE